MKGNLCSSRDPEAGSTSPDRDCKKGGREKPIMYARGSKGTVVEGRESVGGDEIASRESVEQ